MDVLKPALFALSASVLVVMWLNRASVIEAYTEDEAPAEIRLGGVASLDFEKTSLPASPYVVHVGQDSRRRPMALLFTESEDVSEVEMWGGTTRIEGRVTVEGEPAAGGTVRLERHTTAGIGSRDVVVNAEGRYSVRDLPGGRYRVRAWLPGTATMTSSDVFFADAESTVRRDYALEKIQSEPIIEFASGGTMYVGMMGSLGASVTQHRVDNDGIIVTRPVAGTYISARFTDYVDVLSPGSQATNEQGLVVFRLRCRRAGQGSATVTFGQRVIPVPMPGCLNAPPTTPPTASPGDGAAGSSTTSPSNTGPSDTGSSTTSPSNTGPSDTGSSTTAVSGTASTSTSGNSGNGSGSSSRSTSTGTGEGGQSGGGNGG